MKTSLRELAPEERLQCIARAKGLTASESQLLRSGGITPEYASQLSENVIGMRGLPLGIGEHFIVNGEEVLVPMCIEEPSVVAAASSAAKIVGRSGGFAAESDGSLMEVQIFLRVADEIIDETVSIIRTHQQVLINKGNAVLHRMYERGGGVRSVSAKAYQLKSEKIIIVKAACDVCDAMGANALNTLGEALIPDLEILTEGSVLTSILTNYAQYRLARAECTVTPAALATVTARGEDVRDKIVLLYQCAVANIDRAVTHNKGVMNGIDAVALATGQDWRAIGAAAHAYAARDGQYKSLTTWSVDAEGNLVGSIELPLAVGVTGSCLKAHPTVPVALKIMGNPSSPKLAGIMASVGLAQNLAALRALVTTGIQKGHMRLHARQIALAVGARGSQIEMVVAALIAGKDISEASARAILSTLSV